MTWFKVDDGFARHRKTKALRRFGARVRSDALALWLLCGAECASAIGQGGIVDGFVTDEDLEDIARPMAGAALKTACDALVEVGLWLRVDGGYQFHDWGDHQPTSMAVVGIRKKWRERASWRARAKLPKPSPLPVPTVSAVGSGLRFRILKRDGFSCRYCGRHGRDVELHVDHVVPRSRGGTNDPTNLVASCAECNLGKGASDVRG